MSAALVWSNILAYTLQIGLLVGLGALAPAALKIRMPRARLLYWQILLVACLALPWIRNWRQEVVAGAIQVSTVFNASAVTASASSRRIVSFPEIALWLLAAGAAIRLGGIAAGLARLGAYRRRGQTLQSVPGTAGVTLLLSGDVAGPVTFGWRDPVILLPANFLSLEAEMRDAIVCHELLHVARRDWLFTIAEELVRAVLWFHPAIWWVIGEIQLNREQTVDREVIETTRAREPYVDALLLMARAAGSGMPARLDLAPAPMFLRRRHLKRRLMEVVKEADMTIISKTRLACVMGAAVVIVGAACWLVTGAFPLKAAPQTVNDSAGVAVNMNGSQLMHRSPVPYPAEALAKGIEGTVVVRIKVDGNGEVSDAAVLSGPDELRKAVLQSVLNWHFDKSAAFTTRTVNIDFVKPANSSSAVIQATGHASATQSVPFGGLPTPGKLDRIVITGLSDSARAELLSSLPVQEGGEWSGQGQEFAAVREAVNKFDPHLTVGLGRTPGGGYSLYIRVANSGLNTPTPTTRRGIYNVGNGTTPPSVLSKVDPQYTEEARAAKYSGSVILSIVVNMDGKADDIKVVKSLGMGLDESAEQCVRQWVFRPGMNNGVPVNVRAQVEINFRML